MRRFFAWSTLVGLAALGSAQHPSFLPDQQAVLTEREAVIAMPPIALANDVMAADWSPTGKYVLMVRTPPMPKITEALLRAPSMGDPNNPPQLTISSWNRELKRTADLGKVGMNRMAPHAWFAESDVALSFLVETKEIMPGQAEPRTLPGQIIWITPATNQIRTLNAPIAGILFVDVSPAPKGSLALVQFYTEGKTGYFVVDATGRLIRTVSPEKGDVGADWVPDGIHIEERRGVGAESGGIPRIKSTYVNAQTGASVEESAIRIGDWKDGEKPEEFELTTSQLNAPPLQKPNILYLKGAQGSAIALAMNATGEALSPKEDAVLYNEMGIATVRELARIPKDLYLELRNQAMRREAMNRAKQVAIGLIMYASDYDDVLPTQQDWENKVMPYLKNREMLSAFNYTFRGGDMSKIENPAETELGFIDIAGGRIVAYADGHVKFIENPPALAMDRRRLMLNLSLRGR